MVSTSIGNEGSRRDNTSGQRKPRTGGGKIQDDFQWPRGKFGRRRMVPPGCGFFVQGANELLTWTQPRSLGCRIRTRPCRFPISGPATNVQGMRSSAARRIRSVPDRRSCRDETESQSPSQLEPERRSRRSCPDRQNPDLFWGQPRGERQQGARSTPAESFHGSKRRGESSPAGGLVVSTDVRKIESFKGCSQPVRCRVAIPGRSHLAPRSRSWVHRTRLRLVPR